MNEHASATGAPRCAQETRIDGHPAGCGSHNVCVVHAPSGLAQCNECGHWFRLGDASQPREVEDVIETVNAVISAADAAFVPSRSGAGYAAAAGAREIASSWADALREGSTENLLADMDRMVAQLQTLRDCFSAILPVANIGTAPSPRYQPGAELSEIVSCLEGLAQPIAPATVEDHHVTRALYMAQLALGTRRPFPVA